MKTLTSNPPATETVHERIQRLVDEAPPLSDEVCARLRELLLPVVVTQ